MIRLVTPDNLQQCFKAQKQKQRQNKLKTDIKVYRLHEGAGY